MNLDSSERRQRGPSKWSWALVAGGTAVVVACSSDVTLPGGDATWGFVTVAASQTPTGNVATAPIGQFFKGRVGGVPNAQIVFDSCVPDIPYQATTSELVSGVLSLDAGSTIGLKLGNRVDSLPRIVEAIRTYYQKPGNATMPYTPGDSIIVTIPGGGTGGYPAAVIRGKSAESFTMSPIVAPTPTNQKAIDLRWSAPQDPRSAMIVSLRYAVGSETRLTRQTLCSYTDDGVDSIPFRSYQNWNNATTREAVATRLRTTIMQQGDGVLEIISRYQLPLPSTP